MYPIFCFEMATGSLGIVQTILIVRIRHMAYHYISNEGLCANSPKCAYCCMHWVYKETNVITIILWMNKWMIRFTYSVKAAMHREDLSEVVWFMLWKVFVISYYDYIKVHWNSMKVTLKDFHWFLCKPSVCNGSLKV